jgi:hypothetical protein
MSAFWAGAAITQQIGLQRKIESYRQPSGQVPDLPDLAVGQDDPLDTLVDGVHLDLAQMPGAELGGTALDLNESDELLGDAHAVVGELSLDQVLGRQVLFVVAQALAQEVGDQQPGITLVGVAGDQVGQGLSETPDSRPDTIACFALPLGHLTSGRLVHSRDCSPGAGGSHLGHLSSDHCPRHWNAHVCHTVPFSPNRPRG